MRPFLPLLALGLLAPPLSADEPKKAAPESFEVPYRLTIPKHILVRAKINGKGPFNFILDTGAPALFLAVPVAKKIGIKEDEKGWGTFDRFEIEGGVVLKKAMGRIETPFQLEGMNGMGLGGAEIHGIIGYNILAQFRIDVDVTKDKMTWTRLAWQPKHPMGLGQKGGGQGGLEVFGTIMKLLGSFLGRQAEPDVVTRGYVGVEVMDDDGVTVIKSVVANSPAAEAGLKAGDRVVKFRGRAIYGLDEFKKYSWRVAPGEKVEAIIKRGKDAPETTITIKAGEGF
jgi:hypothetical protein